MDSFFVLASGAWAELCEPVYTLRRQVFVEELGLPPELAQDAADGDAWHLVARLSPDQIIAAGRLLRDGQVGRLAVLRAWRGRGVGRALVLRLVELARTQGLTEVWLDAPRAAIRFYRRLGFQAEGALFQAAGIPHQRLRLRLDARAAQAGLGSDEQVLDGTEPSLHALLALIAGARRQLWLYTPYMHPRLYGAGALAHALTKRIGEQPRFRARLLLPPTPEWRRDCAPLANVIERLSALELRHWPAQAPRERPEFQLGLALGDDSALLVHKDPRACCGYMRSRGGSEARKLASFFTTTWEHAAPDGELRPLGI